MFNLTSHKPENHCSLVCHLLVRPVIPQQSGSCQPPPPPCTAVLGFLITSGGGMLLKQLQSLHFSCSTLKKSKASGVVWWWWCLFTGNNTTLGLYWSCFALPQVVVAIGQTFFLSSANQDIAETLIFTFSFKHPLVAQSHCILQFCFEASPNNRLEDFLNVCFPYLIGWMLDKDNCVTNLF